MPVWDLSAALYDTVSTPLLNNIGGDTPTNPTGVAFKSDGSKMYICGRFFHKIYQFSLSTPWDPSTATYDTVSKDVGAQDLNPTDVVFSSDGSKMYVSGSLNDGVWQYALSTPWDLSTATYASKTVSVAARETAIQGLAFSSDGSKMYITGGTNARVDQYTLSTPWDVSTATYASKTVSVSSQDTNPTALGFKDDGTVMFVLGDTNNTVYQYTLGTAWDVSTASYASVSKSVSSETTLPQGLAFKSDGSKMYILGNTADRVYQYTLGSLGQGWVLGLTLG